MCVVGKRGGYVRERILKRKIKWEVPFCLLCSLQSYTKFTITNTKTTKNMVFFMRTALVV